MTSKVGAEKLDAEVKVKFTNVELEYLKRNVGGARGYVMTYALQVAEAAALAALEATSGARRKPASLSKVSYGKGGALANPKSGMTTGEAKDTIERAARLLDRGSLMNFVRLSALYCVGIPKNKHRLDAHLRLDRAVQLGQKIAKGEDFSV